MLENASIIFYWSVSNWVECTSRHGHSLIFCWLYQYCLVFLSAWFWYMIKQSSAICLTSQIGAASFSCGLSIWVTWLELSLRISPLFQIQVFQREINYAGRVWVEICCHSINLLWVLDAAITGESCTWCSAHQSSFGATIYFPWQRSAGNCYSSLQFDSKTSCRVCTDH